MILLLTLLAPQDFQGLLSDDIEVRDRAFEELLRMGPKALPAIRAAKAEGDLKLLLEKAARRIERPAKVAARIPEPVRVTLQAKDRPLKEVLEELGRLGGQTIDTKAAPRGWVTVSLDKVLFWEALDRVCRAHGRAAWSGNSAIEGTPAPAAFQGDVALQLGGAYCEGSICFVDIQGAARGAARPDFAKVRIEAEDGLGTTYRHLSGVVRVAGPAFGMAGLGSFPAAVKKIPRLKGEVTLEYVLTKRVRAALKLAELEKGPVEREGLRFSLALSAGLTPRAVKAPVPPELFDWLMRAEFEISDGKGASFVVAPNWEHDHAQGITTWALLGPWPKDFQPISFELCEPDDVERVSFPFEFKDVPTGMRK